MAVAEEVLELPNIHAGVEKQGRGSGSQRVRRYAGPCCFSEIGETKVVTQGEELIYNSAGRRESYDG